MAAPIVKRGKATLQPSDVCPRCPHLISAHDEAKARQCGSCACVAQNVHADARSYLNVGPH